MASRVLPAVLLVGALRFAASGTSAARCWSLHPLPLAESPIAQRESWSAPQLLQVSLSLFPHLPSPPSHLHSPSSPFHNHSPSLSPRLTFTTATHESTSILSIAVRPLLLSFPHEFPFVHLVAQPPLDPPALLPRVTNFAIGPFLQQCGPNQRIARQTDRSCILTLSRTLSSSFSLPTIDRSSSTLEHPNRRPLHAPSTVAYLGQHPDHTPESTHDAL